MGLVATGHRVDMGRLLVELSKLFQLIGVEVAKAPRDGSPYRRPLHGVSPVEDRLRYMKSLGDLVNRPTPVCRFPISLERGFGSVLATENFDAVPVVAQFAPPKNPQNMDWKYI